MFIANQRNHYTVAQQYAYPLAWQIEYYIAIHVKCLNFY